MTVSNLVENEKRVTNNEKECFTICEDDDMYPTLYLIFPRFPMIFEIKCFVHNIRWHAHLCVVRKLFVCGIRTHLSEWTTGDESWQLVEWTLNMKPLDIKEKIIVSPKKEQWLHWNMNLFYIFAKKKAIYIFETLVRRLLPRYNAIYNIQKPIVGCHLPLSNRAEHC